MTEKRHGDLPLRQKGNMDRVYAILHAVKDFCQPNPHTNAPADSSESAGALGRIILQLLTEIAV